MNTIVFQNVLPAPLRDSPIQGSVWNNVLRLEVGKHYLLTAESGKGKSTFLNILLGIRKDYSGEVQLGNVIARQISPNAYAKLRVESVSCLYQDLRLFGNLTALENITIPPGVILPLTKIREFAEILGVDSLLARKCSTLSLGQQQRIAAIRALAQKFSWLLLDEPFSHLDANNATKLLELVKLRASEQNAGIIATSLGSTSGFEGFELVAL